MGRPAMGGPDRPSGDRVGRRLGRPRRLPRGARRGDLRRNVPDRRPSRPGRADRRDPVASRVRGGRTGARPASAAPRDALFRRRPAAGGGPAGASAAVVARAGHRRDLGEHPRLVLPRPARARARVARGRPRPTTGRDPDPGCRGRRHARGVPYAERPTGLALCRRADLERLGHGSGDGMATDVHPGRAGPARSSHPPSRS